jgi:hypothetical protein
MSTTRKLTELTTDELRALIRDEMRSLIRETVREVLDEIREDDLELAPDIQEYLRKPLEEQGPFVTLEDLKQELGLDG